MKKRSGKSSQKKERAIMIASTALVLSALTVTGVYVRNSNKSPDGGYTIDFSSLEESNSSKVEAEDIPVTDSDLDYDPASTEAGSTTVKNNYGKSGAASAKTDPVDEKAEALRLKEASSDLIIGEGQTKDGESEIAVEAIATEEEVTEAMTEIPSEEEEATEVSSEAVAAQIQPELTFSEADSLVMPLVGNVLINYSTDKSVYFPTLQQYKCNPALVIAATSGASIKAAAPGVVSRIYNDPMTGQTVQMTLGNGYELTYGQLKEVTVSEGAYVAEGEIFAQVADPTRYYAKEGCNLYLKLTKDGVPVNPAG